MADVQHLRAPPLKRPKMTADSSEVVKLSKPVKLVKPVKPVKPAKAVKAEMQEQSLEAVNASNHASVARPRKKNVPQKALPKKAARQRKTYGHEDPNKVKAWPTQIGPFVTDMKLTLRQKNLMRKELVPFFTEERIRTLLVPLTKGTHEISLRLLLWTVTNHAREEEVYLARVDAATGKKQVIHVYQDYRSTLSFWESANFGTFRRGPRIYVPCDGELHETTIAQSNFLRWAVAKGVLQHALDNKVKINASMAAAMRASHADKVAHHKRGGGVKRKRTELVKAQRHMCAVKSFRHAVKI
jgi:hypothetical protein